MNNTSQTYSLVNETATLALGAALAQVCHAGVIFLVGNLGAGKTTFSRGFIQGLGYVGRVKSPTYTLVEPYEVANKHIFHFDLYRLHDPQELEFIGINDYFSAETICLIEWPEHGRGYLPQPDVSCSLDTEGEGRRVKLEAHTVRGNIILDNFLSEQPE
jgi:tRNA threonylcarbamoyladenosine biosynthesis protein TsaE